MNSVHSRSKQFDRLAKPIRLWVWENKWQNFYAIQERAIETLLDNNKDVIISAATARGKTEAAFFPLISRALQQASEGFAIIYIAPLKSLINDQFRRLQGLCDKCQLPIYPWHGDISQSTKQNAYRNPRGILLITPESLESLLIRKGEELYDIFSGTQAIITDELHALLDNERGIHLRSLLTRIEFIVNRKIRRVGLSATLGEMQLVKTYLRPEAPNEVTLLQDNYEPLEIKAQLRGYLQQGVKTGNNDDLEVEQDVTRHLFDKLRGNDNLIFVDSRKNVELYADLLRELSNKRGVENEFFPHHSSINRQKRAELERQLHSATPATAICTSTLELGIDIGNLDCVAQINAPFSVASLRQRLGRSGRRGDPAILRMYAVEHKANSQSKPLQCLYLKTIRSIAMFELLLEKWCEPPAPHALHLSTLVHQILSVIAERSGAKTTELYTILCLRGPFRKVSRNLFDKIIRHLDTAQYGKEEKQGTVIEQTSTGLLLLGAVGEQLVKHYSFYAVFDTPKEYRVIAEGEELGSLPIKGNTIKVGMSIVFSGQRWRIVDIDRHRSRIELTADTVGKPPTFFGSSGDFNDKIAEKMMKVLSGNESYQYIDRQATDILQMARNEFKHLALDKNPVCRLSGNKYLIATGVGTIKTTTLSLALSNKGVSIKKVDGGFIFAECVNDQPLVKILKQIAESTTTSDLISKVGITEKFHPFLSPELLLEDASSSRLDLASLPSLVGKLLKDG